MNGWVRLHNLRVFNLCRSLPLFHQTTLGALKVGQKEVGFRIWKLLTDRGARQMGIKVSVLLSLHTELENMVFYVQIKWASPLNYTFPATNTAGHPQFSTMARNRPKLIFSTGRNELRNKELNCLCSYILLNSPMKWVLPLPW